MEDVEEAKNFGEDNMVETGTNQVRETNYNPSLSLEESIQRLVIGIYEEERQIREQLDALNGQIKPLNERLTGLQAILADPANLVFECFKFTELALQERSRAMDFVDYVESERYKRDILKVEGKFRDMHEKSLRVQAEKARREVLESKVAFGCYVLGKKGKGKVNFSLYVPMRKKDVKEYGSMAEKVYESFLVMARSLEGKEVEDGPYLHFEFETSSRSLTKFNRNLEAAIANLRTAFIDKYGLDVHLSRGQTYKKGSKGVVEVGRKLEAPERKLKKDYIKEVLETGIYMGTRVYTGQQVGEILSLRKQQIAGLGRKKEIKRVGLLGNLTLYEADTVDSYKNSLK